MLADARRRLVWGRNRTATGWHPTGALGFSPVAKVKRIGILTGGGDVPGLNAVIKSVVYRATEAATTSSASAGAGRA